VKGKSVRDDLWWASQVLRFVPSGLGAYALARKVLARTSAASPKIRCQKFSGGAHFELDLTDRAQAQAYLIRRYEPGVVALLARIVPRRGIFCDVGANIGLITFCVGVRRPDVSIYAFEPDPSNAQRWRRNHELNPGVTAKLEEMAVGAAQNDVALIRGQESGWSFIAQQGQPGDVAVPLVNLDAYASAHDIARIDVLKVDVEGYEAHVFEGATSLLERQAIGFIVCELDESLLSRAGATRNAVASFLAEHGYMPKPVPGAGAQRFRRRTWTTSHDVLFAPVT
jgi:FkbM family methyltransferase